MAADIKSELEAHAINAIKNRVKGMNPALEALQSIAEVESTDVGILEALRTHPLANRGDFARTLQVIDFGIIRAAIIGTREIPCFLTETTKSQALALAFCAEWYAKL